jgi:NTP pyrophosphatase (non-canonical NTP hydrolase)
MDFTISELIAKQQKLREAHDWDPHIPENGRNSLLWSVDELGEVIAIIKKKGDRAIIDNPVVRAHFVEEVADVIMYLCDMMDCYSITGEEFSAAYDAKWKRNMTRSWSENASLYEDASDKVKDKE